MNKTGAWLVRYALEQIGITHTFGIPGVHTTEIYDELNNFAIRSQDQPPLLMNLPLTGLEMISAKRYNQGILFIVFNDGELSQIAQMQTMPYNRKTCTVLSDIQLKGIADATGVDYIRMETNHEIDSKLTQALSLTKKNMPVLLDVNIDYSKPTRFTKGILGSNIRRLKPETALRMGLRSTIRKISG